MEKAKLAFFLPNIFTALNLACGFGSVALSFRGDSFLAASVLILGAIFDAVDGRVARMTGTQSSFGEQFDSMSDVVSFGVAPAFLIYQHSLVNLGRLGAVCAFIYLLCGALRLARFNANIDSVSSDYFQGLPIPSAAMALIGYVYLASVVPFLEDLHFVALIYSLFYSILMILNVPFPSFKNSSWVKEHKKAALVLIFLLSAITFSYYRIMVSALITTYVVGSLIYYLTHKGKYADAFDWKSEN